MNAHVLLARSEIAARRKLSDVHARLTWRMHDSGVSQVKLTPDESAPYQKKRSVLYVIQILIRRAVCIFIVHSFLQP